MITWFNSLEMLFNFEGITLKSCDYSEEVPPVPIPNTVVKLLSADDTWGVTPWEIRTSLLFLYMAPWSSGKDIALSRR